jgi:hypothetical protein
MRQPVIKLHLSALGFTAQDIRALLPIDESTTTEPQKAGLVFLEDFTSF